MIRFVVILFSIFIFSAAVTAQAQASKEQQELEKERQQLRRELEETQEQLNKNKKTTKEIISQKALIERKLSLQEKVIDNISQDINFLDNTIYKSQRDINKMQLLLDTLKQDYAKSMVYSYKNRNNSDFLNFIFSASSFNDAIKRITYLKSYRNYREMQGQNILRTQELLRNRINDLSGTKKKKSTVLQVQAKEANVLQSQQEEKDQIVKQLKAQGKELNNVVAAKKKQMAKVSNAITAAIRRAVEEAKRASAAKATEERKNREAELKAAKNSSDNNDNTASTKTIAKVPKKTVIAPVNKQSELLNTDAAVTLNENFKINQGKLPWPVDKGYVLLHYGPNKVGDVTIVNDGLSIGCDIGAPVKVIFGGEVVLINNYDDVELVVVKHGGYFTAYSNLTGVNLNKGEIVQIGQVIGKVGANLDGVGEVKLNITKEKGDLNPEQWLRRR
ncbi:peptidoglycan DD-metalloendopeptidase family protein [Ferruginibacter paludis]|uniref:murein hydrolase activator EnvC family protein n=1 Tax=Ferruginibacter paludis TaxID=1310417 RepID=UPI0025B5E9E6|nr:peptidoglycan DD-metalloendopeptidase family protein [Ferruginibacter paludis]MDN3658806.1 peptidoglycan DD-metalloendopeptidase family protein [Ferruginibacter paludis]